MGLPPNMDLRSGVTAKLPGVVGDLQPFETLASRPETVTVAACPSGTVRIVIPGEPMSKPRMTQRDKWKQRPVVMRYRDWCNRVRAAVGDSLPAPEQIAELNWIAYFEPPRSWSKDRRWRAAGTPHYAKPDRDNIDKAVLDCLFKQDQGIAAGRIEKRWDWKARLEVEIVATTAET